MIERRKKNILIIAGCVLLVIVVVIFLSRILAIKKARRAPPAVKVKGKIAIVIDDWGYKAQDGQMLDGFAYPLTCAVLPSLPGSGEISRLLHEQGFEIILHLPMEPKQKRGLEKNTIIVSMHEEEMAQIISEDLNSVHYAKGVSNHMGSRLTEDKRAVTLVLRQLKKRDLYFLDSYVTAGSVAFSLARNMGLRCAKRDVFLDNRDEPAYIKGQLNKLKMAARRRGKAIGIGHSRKNTLKVLRETMPQMAKEGYELVFVSELVE